MDMTSARSTSATRPDTRPWPSTRYAYIEELTVDIFDGRIEPGRLFDRTVTIDGAPDAHRAVNEREALLMGADGAFITGSDFLMDGGVTASYWFGDVAT